MSNGEDTMDERLQEVQHLFDLTVQVLAQKICMEGIVKQAADSRYWDFCSFQKLSSELELKRRHIIKMNQELTDQLIELDRPFNALELSKFGGNEGAHAGRTSLQSKIRPSSSCLKLKIKEKGKYMYERGAISGR